MDALGYIGIDFGTANSHFAYCEQDGRDAKPIPLSAAEGKPSVPSYLLWEIDAERRRVPKAWGQLAIEEWMLEDDDDSGQSDRYLLTGAFKPDLVTSPMSRDAAKEFLGYARQDMVKNRQLPACMNHPAGRSSLAFLRRSARRTEPIPRKPLGGRVSSGCSA
jgi:hypothetical protein